MNVNYVSLFMCYKVLFHTVKCLLHTYPSSFPLKRVCMCFTLPVTLTYTIEKAQLNKQ